MSDAKAGMAHHDDAATREGEEIADLLSEIGRTFKAQLRGLADSPARHLSLPQRDVLVRIGRRPGCSPASVSERTGRDPGQVTRLVAELEGLDLVERERSVEDRRSVNLKLSRKGRTLFAHMLERRAALSRDMLCDLSAEELVELRRVLQTIRGRLRDMPGDP